MTDDEIRKRNIDTQVEIAIGVADELLAELGAIGCAERPSFALCRLLISSTDLMRGTIKMLREERAECRRSLTKP